MSETAVDASLDRSVAGGPAAPGSRARLRTAQEPSHDQPAGARWGVLVALREKSMRRDLFEEFCREYVDEPNRLRMEHRARLSGARHELTAVEREIRKLIQASRGGVPGASIREEIASLEAKKADLQAPLAAPEMPQLLHPTMADVYREKVTSLCEALEHEDSRAGAAEAIRGLIEAILLAAEGNKLKISPKGGPGGSAERG